MCHTCSKCIHFKIRCFFLNSCNSNSHLYRCHVTFQAGVMIESESTKRTGRNYYELSISNAVVCASGCSINRSYPSHHIPFNLQPSSYCGKKFCSLVLTIYTICYRRIYVNLIEIKASDTLLRHYSNLLTFRKFQDFHTHCV